MNTLSRVLELLHVDPTGIDLKARRMPIEVPNVGRYRLAQLFAELGFTEGCEVGTEQGAYAEEICKVNPGAHLICVDAWRTYDFYREHLTQSKLDAFFESTQKRLAPYNVTYIRKFSVDAAKEVPDGSLDWVYLDANHTLPYVIADLQAWIPKVRVNGLICGHDFCRRKQGPYEVHVVQAVQAWTDAYFVSPWFVLGSKQVIDGQERDRPRSFMWVKS